jgi:serine/threonine-protein phosphatase PGAM5
VSRLLYLVRHGQAPDDGGLNDVGREQARLVGERLHDVPLSTIHHSPLPRAAQSASLIAGHLGAAPQESDLLGDYPPFVPPRETLPAAWTAVIDSYPSEVVAGGPELAEAALRRYAGDSGPDELIVTHSFLIGWFVRHALDAPPARWLGLNSGNGALTVIRYRPDRPPILVLFNDMSHLPPALRWTGFPRDLQDPTHR